MTPFFEQTDERFHPVFPCVFENGAEAVTFVSCLVDVS